MKFALIRSGSVESIIEAPSGFTIAGAILVACDDAVNRGDLYDGMKFTRQILTASPVTSFYPFDFLGLFTSAERAGIYASTDPIVRDAITKVTAIVTQIDVTDQDTIDLLGYLTSVNLLTQLRADQILSGQYPTS
jgi:hypothetical protein